MWILYIMCFVFEYSTKFIAQLLRIIVLTYHTWNSRLKEKLDCDNPDLSAPGHKVCVSVFWSKSYDVHNSQSRGEKR